MGQNDSDLYIDFKCYCRQSPCSSCSCSSIYVCLIYTYACLLFFNTFPVTDFAKKTGDYAVLSATDIRLIALTYQLEVEHVGRDHLRQSPVIKRYDVNVKPAEVSKPNVNNGLCLPTKVLFLLKFIHCFEFCPLLTITDVIYFRLLSVAAKKLVRKVSHPLKKTKILHLQMEISVPLVALQKKNSLMVKIPAMKKKATTPQMKA